MIEKEFKIFDKEYLYLNYFAQTALKNFLWIFLFSSLLAAAYFTYLKISNEKNRNSYLGEIYYLLPYHTTEWDTIDQILSKAGPGSNNDIVSGSNNDFVEVKYKYLDDLQNYAIDIAILNHFKDFLISKNAESQVLETGIKLRRKNINEDVSIEADALIISIINNDLDSLNIFLDFFVEYFESEFAKQKKEHFNNLVLDKIETYDEQLYSLNKKFQVMNDNDKSKKNISIVNLFNVEFEDNAYNKNSLIVNFFDIEFSLNNLRNELLILQKNLIQLDLPKIFYSNKKTEISLKKAASINILNLIFVFGLGFIISSSFFMYFDTRKR